MTTQLTVKALSLVEKFLNKFFNIRVPFPLVFNEVLNTCIAFKAVIRVHGDSSGLSCT